MWLISAACGVGGHLWAALLDGTIPLGPELAGNGASWALAVFSVLSVLEEADPTAAGAIQRQRVNQGARSD
jgi:hypothetical protein